MSKLTLNKIASDSKLRAAEEKNRAAEENYRKSEELLKNEENLINKEAEHIVANYKRKLEKESQLENTEYKNNVVKKYSEKLQQVNENIQILSNFILKNCGISPKAILDNYRLSKKQNNLNKTVHDKRIPCITPDYDENTRSL